ncbi:hypothetical protein AMECASPLE_024969 [Ameca splendens]|uniref:Uncharacterized protein n=1 Tax=Ameca splendens TaxID=208324 RepID=A0ABV0XTI8_9TELE
MRTPSCLEPSHTIQEQQHVRWRLSMVVGSGDRCIALSLITREFKRSLLPALQHLSVNQLCVFNSTWGHFLVPRIPQRFKSSSLEKFPAGGVLVPCSFGLIHKRTLLTLQELDQTHLIQAALHLNSQAPPSSFLAVHLLTPL